MTNALGVDIPSLPHLGYLSRKAPVAKEILRWARWEPGTQSQNSILLVGIWWAVCLGFWVWIIYILPSLPILLVARSWSVAAVVVDSKQKKAGNGISVDALNEKQQQTQQQLNDILQVLLPVENVMRSIVDFVQWSNNPAKTRRTFLKLVYVYFFWITAHQLFDTRYILLVLGTVALTWYSPWIVRFREYIQYPLIKSVFAALFIGSLETDEEKKDGIMQQALKFQSNVLKKAETVQKVGNSQFTFVIYENQRLWPFGQWEGRTLPVERAPWSDDANETVPTKTNFALPDAMQVTVIDPARPHMEYKKTWAWKWLDPVWQLNFDGNVDELGWEYGTIVWTMFDRYPKGLMSTRRRRWSRRAELDYRVQAVYKQTNDETTIANNAAKIAQEASQVASPLQSPIAADFVMASENSNSNSGNSPPASPAPTSTASMTSLPRFDTSIMNGRSSMTTSVPPPRSPDHARRGSAVDFVTSPTPVPRPSQSTAIISNSGRTTSPDSFRRRRGNSFAQSNGHTSSMYASSIVSEDWNNSMASFDKRASVQSRDTIGSKKRREAVWKSIVRN